MFFLQVVTITRKFIDLHTKYADKIIEAMVNTKETGTPANLPIWWVDPLDPIAQNIGSGKISIVRNLTTELPVKILPFQNSFWEKIF